MISRLISIALLWATVLISSPALAHSVLVSSDPAANASVEPGARTFSLVFDSRVDPKRSRLYLEFPDQTKQTLIPEAGATKGTLTVKVDLAADGPHVLTYEVLSIDGHIARGALTFTVASKR